MVKGWTRHLIQGLTSAQKFHMNRDGLGLGQKFSNVVI